MLDLPGTARRLSTLTRDPARRARRAPGADLPLATQLQTFGLPRKRLRFAPNLGRSRRVQAPGKQAGNFSMPSQMGMSGNG